ncbi:hypothetical protein FORC81_p419 (plasmid) [Escherichia coli]|nr:hypothetical protein FORC81_p419 [Escherichia coli]
MQYVQALMTMRATNMEQIRCLWQLISTSSATWLVSYGPEMIQRYNLPIVPFGMRSAIGTAIALRTV